MSQVEFVETEEDPDELVEDESEADDLGLFETTPEQIRPVAVGRRTPIL